MTKDILFLLIATLALLIILISTINEVITTLHESYSFRAHPGRIQGESDPGPEVVEWLNGMSNEQFERAIDVIIEKGRFCDDYK